MCYDGRPCLPKTSRWFPSTIIPPFTNQFVAKEHCWILSQYMPLYPTKIFQTPLFDRLSHFRTSNKRTALLEYIGATLSLYLCKMICFGAICSLLCGMRVCSFIEEQWMAFAWHFYLSGVVVSLTYIHYTYSCYKHTCLLSCHQTSWYSKGNAGVAVTLMIIDLYVKCVPLSHRKIA